MKEYFSGDEIRFVVVHGDITWKKYISEESIVTKINEQTECVKNRYRTDRKIL